jgi:hypothetical protein
MWFKVLLNKDLSIASCEQVDQAFENGKHVIYCEADTKDAALKYAKQLAKTRIISKERRAAAKISGRCNSCGHARDSEVHRRCLDRKGARAKTVREAIKQGLPRPGPTRPPGPITHQHGTHRWRILTEVRERYVSMGREAFFSWLETEIKAASWRHVA